MEWFRDLKIRNKLLLSFSVILLILAFLSINTYLKMDNIHEMTINIVEHNNPTQQMVNESLQQLIDAQSGELWFYMYGKSENINWVTERVRKAIDAANTAIESSSAQENKTDLKKAVELIKEYENRFLRITEKSNKLILEKKVTISSLINDPELETDRKEILITMNDAQEVLIKVMDRAEGLLADNLKKTIQTIDDLEKQLFILSIIAIIFGLFLAFYLGSIINNAVKALLNAAGEISKGNVNVSVDINSRDEFGILAQTFRIMAESINSVVNETNNLVQAALDGKLSTRADADRHKGDFRKVIEGINSTLDAVIKPVNESVAILQKMSEGNFSAEMTGEYKGDYAILKNALNATLSSLNQLISQVSLTVEQVASGSEQVSSSSQSLSQGATEQASALEEITSSMHEIGAQTGQNAENANRASQLSIQSKDEAERGNEQMNELMKAIGEISDSSKSISKIIKVIDEIAFQTNLLALNAAVEAARAGRHGKGFAVVAEEVRNLAARSATAAKETSELIEGAVRKSENVSGVAEKTLNILKEIEKSATKVADIIGEIAASSNEQAQGVSQVNSGLGQIDLVTQQNTANAEESASAAEELYSQAEELRFMLAKFKLNMDNQILEAQMRNKSRKQTVGTSHHFQKGALKHSNNPKSIIRLDDSEFGKY